jgi:hypothetical protein
MIFVDLNKVLENLKLGWLFADYFDFFKPKVSYSVKSGTLSGKIANYKLKNELVDGSSFRESLREMGSIRCCRDMKCCFFPAFF